MPRQPGKLYQLEGVVLSRRNQGEADRVVTMLAATGLVSLLAKGVRKTRSRKAGHVELFSRTRILASRVQRSWDILSQAEAQAVRSRLQEDFELGTCARYVAELVLRFFEGETDPRLFALVDEVLALLDSGADPALLVRWYEQQLLLLAGFRPEWEQCVGERETGLCRAALRPRPDDRLTYGIDPERGGALCPDCLTAGRDRDDPGVRPLSPSALSWLQALQRHPYAEVVRFSLPAKTAGELSRVMEHYVTYYLERRPATLRFMRRNG